MKAGGYRQEKEYGNTRRQAQGAPAFTVFFRRTTGPEYLNAPPPVYYNSVVGQIHMTTGGMSI